MRPYLLGSLFESLAAREQAEPTTVKFQLGWAGTALDGIDLP